jgi:hypothetical protein
MDPDPHIMPIMAPALKVMELFVADWPGLRPTHITPAHAAVAADKVRTTLEGRPEVLKITCILNAYTLELGPAMTL